jgi:signal transduction histidine kinase
VVEVSDDGPGFADDPETAFVRRGPGTGHGIGLSLARSLAHAEGGRLYVSSPGPKPVLTLVLPAPTLY